MVLKAQINEGSCASVELTSSYANMTPVIAKPVKQEYKYAAITI